MYNRIKEIRQQVGLTQTQFGERINLSRNYIAVIEIGQREPSERTLADICREFNVNRHWLETGEGEMFNSISKELEIMRFVQKITKKSESELDQFRLNLISALAKMDEDEWETLAKIIDKLANGK